MRAILTGSTNGIGKSILKKLIKNGYDIITINRREDKTEGISKNLIYDLSKKKEVLQMIDDIGKYDIDILINNAGGSEPMQVSDLDINIIEHDLYLNYITPLLLIKTFYPKMIDKTYSRIINISSISSKRGTPLLYTYSSAKAALDSLTQSIASTKKSKGFSINSICPGGIFTNMSIEGRKKISLYSNLSEYEYQNIMIESMKLQDLINVDDVTNLVEFLLLPSSSSISGQAINICGALEVK